MSTTAKVKSVARRAVDRSPVPLRVVRDIRMETHLALVRAARRLTPAVRATERDIRSRRNIMLNFGCGGRILPGWGKTSTGGLFQALTL